MEIKKCEECGDIIKGRGKRFCSKECDLKQRSREWKVNNPMKNIDNSGKNNPMYGKVPWNYKKEGSKRKDGYIRIAIKGQRVLKHRYLMEEELGRKLLLSEVVHHKDGNPSNNDIDNLILTSRKQHINLHRLALTNGRLRKERCPK